MGNETIVGAGQKLIGRSRMMQATRTRCPARHVGGSYAITEKHRVD
jgi:hypothetical protein